MGSLFVREDLAALQADLDLQSRPERDELGVQSGDGSVHIEGSADGPERVVFVGERQTEHATDGVADELRDGSVMTLDRSPHRFVVAMHDYAERLGIEARRVPSSQQDRRRAQ